MMDDAPSQIYTYLHVSSDTLKYSRLYYIKCSSTNNPNCELIPFSRCEYVLAFKNGVLAFNHVTYIKFPAY